MRWLYRHGVKRLLDVGLAGAGLALFALPMALIAWRIRAEYGKPVLFRQKRVGKGGRVFHIWKFRTMTEEGGITPLGRWLRATALDELPQLLHIAAGQMSFVGPRPLVPEELRELHRIPQGARRLAVQPGLAGLAQVSAPKTPSLSERILWDCAYVERLCLALDLWIFVRAVWTTLRGAWEKKP